MTGISVPGPTSCVTTVQHLPPGGACDRIIELILTDGNTITDLDGAADGNIDDPAAVGEGAETGGGGGGTGGIVSSGGGSSGGGCSAGRSTGLDPLFPLLLLGLAITRFWRWCYSI